jgi:TolA-binding protein
MLEDSLFAATERFVAAAQPNDARQALVAMGRRASEGERWDVVAAAFARVADQWPADALAPEARKFVGDARYRQGRYAEAQGEWKRAQELAAQRGRKALGDSIVNVRVAAAAQAADSLVRQGAFVVAADSILAGIAADIGDPARAADVLRNAVEVHLAADSTLRARGDSAGIAQAQAARVRAIGAIETLANRFPAYQHTLTYSALRARLLSDVGRPADAAAALLQLAEANPRWPGRADALVRAAVLLDSVGHAAPAAAAFERFALAYPTDKRAPDALYNAGVILRDAGDQAGAARAFKAFTTRFPREPRVPQANLARWAALKAAGDTVALNGELATLCAGWRPPATAAAATAYTPVCADRAGSAAFRAGMAGWERYAGLTLVIATRAQLTRAGVDAASAPKLQALRAMTQQFSRAVASGVPEWVAAGTFQTGLAQWYYGLFLRDVQLPADLTDAQRTGAQAGSAQQAQQYFDAAVKAWTALVDKAAADTFNNAWVDKARAALRGEGVPARERVP